MRGSDSFDLAGNSLTVNQAQLDSPNITIDKNVPSVTNLTLYSNNSNSSLARAGDLINITLEASEQIYNATLEILGTEINMTESNNIAYANIFCSTKLITYAASCVMLNHML